jgi:hypothetical protein
MYLIPHYVGLKDPLYPHCARIRFDEHDVRRIRPVMARVRIRVLGMNAITFRFTSLVRGSDGRGSE